ncbi:Gfo/Idh/MocA family oxidoreductase [Vibrio penaeicida]|uniref:Gfo/Idh/MocA-like oxidoreductase N-terminal domain-containing protein n=3 Tax=Vibrio penaeicida TaxID=104609 RepID=A0AAV5NWC1_9VIBR|nr:Gfo/Idh/MocA family oxidoreductase [Vibrio penaeicida]GLQ74875.1 hypothetical protein GCM10007932_42370 [Vibrio penaeicida]
MSKIVIIGYGYMGNLFRETFLKLGYRDISIVEPRVSNGIGFYSDLFEFWSKNFSKDNCYYFVCSPASTHEYYLNLLLQNDAKKIFLEKPGVIDNYKYNYFLELAKKKNAQVFIGYILRQSSLFSSFKNELSSFLKRGFKISKIDVDYKKYKINTSRDKFDLGVFEEFFHIADMVLNNILNYISFHHVSINNQVNRDGRLLHLDCSIKMNKSVLVHVNSSFISSEKLRRFDLLLDKGSENINVVIEFDKENYDSLLIYKDGVLLMSDTKESNIKLENELSEILTSFKCGDGSNNNLHTLQDSYKIAMLNRNIVQSLTGKNKMTMIFDKETLYKGASNGNTFIICDIRGNRVANVENLLKKREDENVDSILILEDSKISDFKVRVIEKDGSESKACINGFLLIWEKFSNTEIGTIEGKEKLFNLKKMNNKVSLSLDKRYSVHQEGDLYFIDFVEPHVVKVNSVCYNSRLTLANDLQNRYKNGVNINFLESYEGHDIEISTFERGVNDFTLSCASGSLSTAIVLNELAPNKDAKYVVTSKGGRHVVYIDKRYVEVSCSRIDLKLNLV